MTCLEANEATPADVFVYWHTFLQNSLIVIRDPQNEIPDGVQQELIAILEKHHQQLFGKDRRLSTAANAYLCAAYLHPGV